MNSLTEYVSEETARHDVGDPLFERSHIPLATHQDAGLGPLFNANSCVACHVRNGRGAPVPGVSLVRVALQEANGATPVPAWGWQVQDHAIFGHQPEATMDLTWQEEPQAGDEPPLQKVHVGLIRPNGEAVADAEMNRSLRTAPPLIGLGRSSDLLVYNEVCSRYRHGRNGRNVLLAIQPPMGGQSTAAWVQFPGRLLDSHQGRPLSRQCAEGLASNRTGRITPAQPSRWSNCSPD